MEEFFNRLDPKRLTEIAGYLRWDPVTKDTPITLLSHLSEGEKLAWLGAHRAGLAEELCSVGSHTFGRRRGYPEIVHDLGKQIGASFSSKDATPDIEQKIVEKFVASAWEKLTPEQRAELKHRIEEEASKYGSSIKGEMAGFTALGAAQLSGFGVYMLASSLLGAINGALGLGLTFGAFAGLSSAISVVIGPLGWAALGLFAVAKLGTPNYKKLLPVVVLIALERRKSDHASAGALLELSAAPPRPIPTSSTDHLRIRRVRIRCRCRNVSVAEIQQQVAATLNSHICEKCGATFLIRQRSGNKWNIERKATGAPASAPDISTQESTPAVPDGVLTPSMRRPVDVKAFLAFFAFFP